MGQVLFGVLLAILLISVGIAVVGPIEKGGRPCGC